MQIRNSELDAHLQKKVAPLYLLIGQEYYFLNQSFARIKSFIKKIYEDEEKPEEQVISIQSAEDWDLVIEAANSYSLFAQRTIISVFYEKKTLEAGGKKSITNYLQAINDRCFIIIRAPNITAKQVAWLATYAKAVVVVSYPLNANQIKTWISNELKKNSLDFEYQIPDLIYQHTQGNMLACAQAIEKIALYYSMDKHITLKTVDVLSHLSDQCANSLFELIEACLLGIPDKALHIIRQSAQNKTEITLVLWILTQEVRILLQLSYLVAYKMDFKSACNQLKIWPQRQGMYQSSLKRLNNNILEQIHSFGNGIDAQIKTNLNTQAWNALEQLALALCLGQYKA